MRSGLYMPSAYHAALSVASLPFIILFSVLGGFITYGMVGLRTGAGPILMFAVLISLVSMCAIQVLVAFVYGSHTQDMAYMNAVGYSTLGILLMGFWIRIRLIRIPPLRWLSYIFYHRWALVGFSENELTGRRFFYPDGCQNWPAPYGIAPFDKNNDTAGYEEAKKTWPMDPANNYLNLPIQYLTESQLQPKCTELQSGQGVLEYWGFEQTAWQIVLVLLLFYSVFHAISYFYLKKLVRRH